jgi:hypothetical protein
MLTCNVQGERVHVLNSLCLCIPIILLLLSLSLVCLYTKKSMRVHISSTIRAPWALFYSALAFMIVRRHYNVRSERLSATSITILKKEQA